MRQMSDIMERIIRHQEGQPSKRAVTLSEVTKAGVLSDEDRAFLKDNAVRYTPASLEIGERVPGMSFIDGSGKVFGVSVVTQQNLHEDPLDEQVARQLAFLRKCLDAARPKAGRDGHVSAAQLLAGAVAVAQASYGANAAAELRALGVDSSRALGEILFKLIDTGYFSKRPEDRIEDFDIRGPLDELLAERSSQVFSHVVRRRLRLNLADRNDRRDRRVLREKQ